ncbi:MAG TPA: RNA methyltransferase [Microbacteriaceae bacterium]|nr:RNA methyltransferase [Microbacteriaceae bacterium]
MIDNPRSPRVRAVAKLAKRDGRRESGRFLLEGPQAVGEALAYRPDLLEAVYATKPALERHGELVRDAKAAGVDISSVTEKVLEAMADTVTPQGVVAVARQFPSSLQEIVAAGPRLVAVLEEIRDPGNAGTILRAADAAGADAVVFSGHTVDPYHPKVVRATTGSLFHVPHVVGVSLGEAAEALRAAGLQVLAADVDGDDLLEARADLARPTAWVFGNEAHGLDAERLALVDRSLRLPIYGRAESLNLATAASVCLYESAFAQRA